MPNFPPPPPIVEYHVVTECGRNFAWSAVDLDQLHGDLKRAHYKPVHIELQSEYEAEIRRQHEQEKLNAEFTKEIEGDAA